MLKKIFCFIILGVLVLSGCASNTEKQSSKVEDEKKILTITSDYDYAYDLNDNRALSEHHDDIALIEIIDIEGSSNYNDKLQTYVDIYTYGKAEVKAVYKGNLKTGEMIDFSRLGGQIPYDEWKKGLNERQLERLKDEDYTDVVNRYEDDIEIEKGKTYLVFLDHTSAQKENEYAITGFAYGLREVKDADIQTRSAEVMVKNNVTGEYEVLSKVVVLD